MDISPQIENCFEDNPKRPSISDSEESSLPPLHHPPPSPCRSTRKTRARHKKGPQALTRSSSYLLRGRSAPSISSQLPPIQLSEPEAQSTQPANATPELCKEVLELFVLISEQQASPFRSSDSPTSECAEMIGQPTVFTMEDGRDRDMLAVDQSESSSRPTTLDFNSMGWLQQKCLLERELRRLLKWDCTFREEKGLSTNHNTKVLEASFSKIGRALTELLRDDAQFRKHVDRIKHLSNNKDRTMVAPVDVSHSTNEDCPLESIQRAINDLFGLLHSLKRKRDQLVGNLRSDSTVLNTRPAKISTRFEEYIKSPKNGKSDPHLRRRSSRNKNAQNSKIQTGQSEGREIRPESKIVLKIADRPHVFRKSETLTCIRNVRRSIRKAANSQAPNQPIPKIGSEDTLLPSDNVKIINLALDFSYAGIVNELLALARIQEMPQSSEPNRNVSCLKLNPELSPSLQRFDSILALITSLPHWQINITPGLHGYARSAISMIYISLLEGVVGCAVNFSQEFLAPNCSRTDVQFFRQCIQRLSNLDQEMYTEFQPFQPQLQRIIMKLSALKTNPEPASPAVQNEVALNNGTSSAVCVLESDCRGDVASSESVFEYCFLEYQPLSLAWYLSPIANYIPSDSEDLVDGEIPSGLESMTVNNLFILLDRK